jgi:hypothetical protein
MNNKKTSKLSLYEITEGQFSMRIYATTLTK